MLGSFGLPRSHVVLQVAIIPGWGGKEITCSPTTLAGGSPFVLSLSAQACNVGITLFRPPLSTEPLLVVLLLLFLPSKRFADQKHHIDSFCDQGYLGINFRQALFR